MLASSSFDIYFAMLILLGSIFPSVFSRLLFAFLLSQCDSILSPLDAAGPASKTLALSPKLFQGAHVYDLQPEFCLAPSIGSTPKFLEAYVLSNGLQLPIVTVVCLLRVLTEESHAILVHFRIFQLERMLLIWCSVNFNICYPLPLLLVPLPSSIWQTARDRMVKVRCFFFFYFCEV